MAISNDNVTKHLRLSIAWIMPPLPVFRVCAEAAFPSIDRITEAWAIAKSP